MPPDDEGGGPVDSRERAGAKRRIEQGERCAQRKQHHADVHLEAGERGADDAWHETQQAEERRQLMPGHRAGARCRVPRPQRPRHCVGLLEGGPSVLRLWRLSRRAPGADDQQRHVGHRRHREQDEGADSMPARCATLIGDHAEQAGGRERAGADAAGDGDRHQDGVHSGAPGGGHAGRSGGEPGLRRSHCRHHRGQPEEQHRHQRRPPVGARHHRRHHAIEVPFNWAMPKK